MCAAPSRDRVSNAGQLHGTDTTAKQSNVRWGLLSTLQRQQKRRMQLYVPRAILLAPFHDISNASKYNPNLARRISHLEKVQPVSPFGYSFGADVCAHFWQRALIAKVPALYWLSGLTCDDTNFIFKAGVSFPFTSSVRMLFPVVFFLFFLKSPFFLRWNSRDCVCREGCLTTRGRTRLLHARLASTLLTSSSQDCGRIYQVLARIFNIYIIIILSTSSKIPSTH